jgi:hypothetical protein
MKVHCDLKNNHWYTQIDLCISFCGKRPKLFEFEISNYRRDLIINYVNMMCIITRIRLRKWPPKG